MSWSGNKGVNGESGICKQYGKSYNKLKHCATCNLAEYCKDSTQIEKVHVEYTTKENFAEVENIAQYAKANNISGQVIANLLTLTDFNLVKFWVVICRLGNLTYKEIANFLGISDVQVFKYCETLSPVLKKLIKHKACTMLEIEEAFKKFKQPENQKKYFERTFKKLVQLEFNFCDEDKGN